MVINCKLRQLQATTWLFRRSSVYSCICALCCACVLFRLSLLIHCRFSVLSNEWNRNVFEWKHKTVHADSSCAVCIILQYTNFVSTVQLVINAQHIEQDDKKKTFINFAVNKINIKTILYTNIQKRHFVTMCTFWLLVFIKLILSLWIGGTLCSVSYGHCHQFKCN